jgi:hypothetical protein
VGEGEALEPGGVLLPSGWWRVRKAKNWPRAEQGVAEHNPAAAACRLEEQAISCVKYGCGSALMAWTEDVLQLADRPSSDSFTRSPSPAILLLTNPPIQPSARADCSPNVIGCRTQQRRQRTGRLLDGTFAS